MADQKHQFEPQPSDLGTLGFLIEGHAEDRRLFRAGLVTAVAFHVVAFVLTWPTIASPPPEAPEKPPIRIVQLHIYEPPDPVEVELPKLPRAEKVPIPDPTPDEPEPFREAETVSDDSLWDDQLIFVGDGIEPPPVAEPDPGPVIAGVQVTKPRIIFQVKPQYTEGARRAHLEGVVILALIIDTEGRVSEAKVLRGLPLGLTEKALEAATQWVFEPSTLNGRPVPVQYNLTVSFRLQGAS